jgi:actin-related protein
MEEEILAVVIDNGSSSIKAGMAGDDAPRCDFPAAVMQGHKEVGRDAWSRRQMIDVEYPIK